MNALSLGRQDGDSPQQRMLRGVHETFSRELEAALSAFLQAEVGAGLETIACVSASDLFPALKAPACLIVFQLDPLPDRAILSLDCATVFSLLELLLGGQSGSEPVETRNLTEIEWALLEEVVRVLVGSLGEAWKTVDAVEFKVQTLESDPELLPVHDPALLMVRLAFTLQLGEQQGRFQIAVPQTFFEIAVEPVEPVAVGPVADDVRRNIALLEEAKVELEVMLEGSTMAFNELARLTTGQVVRFDYPLQKPLQARVNGAVSIPCQIVSVGRKRAFQVEALP